MGEIALALFTAIQNKSLRFNEFGSLNNLFFETQTISLLPPGEVLVEVHAASINPSDVKNIEGAMEGTSLPRTPGRDFAGVVIQGPEAWLGKSVWGTGGDLGFSRDGTHAQYLLIPEAALAEKPNRLTMAEASAVGVNYMAAWLGLERVGLNENDIVAVIGASGGVGSAVTQIAKWKKATVIGIDRTLTPGNDPNTSQPDLRLSSQQDDLQNQLLAFTQGKGASIVFDTVGGPMFETALGLLGHQGRHIAIASNGSRKVTFDLIDFYHQEVTLYGVDTRKLDVTASAEILRHLEKGFESGSLKPSSIEALLPLDQAIDAYGRVNRHEVKGKLVLTPHLEIGGH
ncbi:MAG: zinc-binding alcohol dehydrogenase family protein [Cyanobacteria bacterium]|nr:zinc-binding alcohol dehydrogenase family protein [Cyanobacteriota bacterium]